MVSVLLIGRDQYAGRGRHALDKAKRVARAPIGEEPPARSEDERVNEQNEVVDEPLSQERLNENTAAEDDKILARRRFQSGDGGGRVAHEKRGVLPREGLLQRGGYDVLLGVVEDWSEGIIGAAGPDFEEIFVGPPPEEELGAARHALAHLLALDRVVVRHGPAAVLEVAAWIFIGSTGRLHDAVERDVVGDDHLSHFPVSGKCAGSKPASPYHERRQGKSTSTDESATRRLHPPSAWLSYPRPERVE